MPLNSILGFTQLLQTDTTQPLTADQLTSVSYIKESGEHLLELINEILDLSRIDAGKLELDIQVIDLVLIVQQVISIVTAEAKQSDIQVLSVFDTEQPIYVSADVTKLRQVLLNFASNAIKYNCVGGKVNFELIKREDRRVRIQVSDTGEGVAEQDLAKIFEPFNRLGKNNSTIPGTGIGLTVCQQLASLMQAEIGVYNNAEGGLTIWLEFEQA